MQRHDFLRELHRLVRPRTYLEIGVNTGKSLALSRVPSIGIDPAFTVTTQLRGDIQLARATSDDFFDRPDPIAHLRGGRNVWRNLRHGRPILGRWRDRTVIDLAFIDGMHLSEFALRDFMSVERYSAWSTVIVFDDMLPRSVEEAARDRVTGEWAGDVYKVAAVLREHRPDLTVLTVDTEPTGVMVVLGADPTNRTLHDRYPAIEAAITTPDPQVVPGDVLGRRGSIDPDRLVASPAWATLRSARGRSRGRGYERVRAAFDAVDRPATSV
ncbi:MAG TPA: class I SAM-dependent methyltransferase [Candidatus Limnocylindrales bacterium]